jgi:hypothetical protein
MMKKYGYRILETAFLFMIILLGIFVTAFIAQYVSTGTNFVEDLSIVLSERCSGSLYLSTTDECTVKAKF